jgi:hypothetical protein
VRGQDGGRPGVSDGHVVGGFGENADVVADESAAVGEEISVQDPRGVVVADGKRRHATTESHPGRMDIGARSAGRIAIGLMKTADK